MSQIREIFLRIANSKICMKDSSEKYLYINMNESNKNSLIRYQSIEYEVLFHQMVFIQMLDVYKTI